MSFLPLRQGVRLQNLRVRRTCYRLASRRLSSKQAGSPYEPRKSSIKNFRWYGLAAITASALSVWAWNTSTSRQMALRPLSTSYFTPTTLTSSEETSKNTKLIRLRFPPEILSKASNESDFQLIWSVYVKDSDIQIERPYTPLEGVSSDGEMLFWVKKYPHGEMGRWLHAKKPGETIEIRGPERTWTWKDDAWDNVIMIAGGTGITPFYQLLHSIFPESGGKNTRTKFTLLQSYKSPKDLPPPLMLESLSAWERSQPHQLKTYTFVDSFNGDSQKSDLSVGRISKDVLRSALKSTSGRTIVLICGPDSMINALAGPKARDQSQGPVGGALGTLNDGAFEVWKL